MMMSMIDKDQFISFVLETMADGAATGHTSRDKSWYFLCS